MRVVAVSGLYSWIRRSLLDQTPSTTKTFLNTPARMTGRTGIIAGSWILEWLCQEPLHLWRCPNSKHTNFHARPPARLVIPGRTGITGAAWRRIHYLSFRSSLSTSDERVFFWDSSLSRYLFLWQGVGMCQDRDIPGLSYKEHGRTPGDTCEVP